MQPKQSLQGTVDLKSPARTRSREESGHACLRDANVQDRAQGRWKGSLLGFPRNPEPYSCVSQTSFEVELIRHRPVYWITCPPPEALRQPRNPPVSIAASPIACTSSGPSRY